MEKCKNCNWFALDKEHKGECFCCLPLGTDIEVSEAEIDRDCPMFSQMSNADRIRSMSDAEMAEWLYNHDTITAKKGRLSKEDLLKWLKSEAKE